MSKNNGCSSAFFSFLLILAKVNITKNNGNKIEKIIFTSLNFYPQAAVKKTSLQKKFNLENPPLLLRYEKVCARLSSLFSPLSFELLMSYLGRSFFRMKFFMMWRRKIGRSSLLLLTPSS